MNSRFNNVWLCPEEWVYYLDRNGIFRGKKDTNEIVFTKEEKLKFAYRYDKLQGLTYEKIRRVEVMQDNS